MAAVKFVRCLLLASLGPLKAHRLVMHTGSAWVQSLLGSHALPLFACQCAAAYALLLLRGAQFAELLAVAHQLLMIKLIKQSYPSVYTACPSTHVLLTLCCGHPAPQGHPPPLLSPPTLWEVSSSG